MKRVQIFVWAFMLSGLVSFATGGCGVETCENCETPELPSGKLEYRLQTMEGFDESGTPVQFSLNMTQSEITVTSDKVRIEYERRGTHHVVQYDIVPN